RSYRKKTILLAKWAHLSAKLSNFPKGLQWGSARLAFAGNIPDKSADVGRPRGKVEPISLIFTERSLAFLMLTTLLTECFNLNDPGGAETCAVDRSMRIGQ